MSFGYLLSHPSALGIVFANPLALSFLFLIPLILRHRPEQRLRPLLLRAATLTLVIFLLADLRLTASLPERRMSVVALVDNSLSVADEDNRWANMILSELRRVLAPDDEIAIVTFATTPVISQPPAPPDLATGMSVHPARFGTNVEHAMEVAAGLLPKDGDRRILLLSDGNETRGDARRMLPKLAHVGVRVDVAVPPSRPRVDIAVDKLVLDPLVAEGMPFPLRVVVSSNAANAPATLKLFLDGKLVESTALRLVEGLSSYEITYRLNGRGVHAVRVELHSPNDQVDGNNSRELTVTVTPQPRVLFLTTAEHSLVASVLARKGEAVDVVRPSNFPTTMRELLAYHAVVAEELSAHELRPEAHALIESYVSDFGGGFVFAGGSGSFGDPGFQGSAIQRLLPVTMEPRSPDPKGRDPVALMVLIDRSNSMAYNSRIPTLYDGEKLRYAKEAALAVIRPLKDQDMVGVIAFDSQEYPIAPLRPLKENRSVLERNIPRLVQDGGTDFFDALHSAAQQLAESRVSRRHIILLTDGDTNRAASEHGPLIEAVAESGISVTTIRIGRSEGVHLLQEISERTGGQFHHVDDVTMLPDLMLRDATRAIAPLGDGSQQYLAEGGTQVEALNGVPAESVPPLRGYAYSRARRGADVALRIRRLDDADPLLAVWHFGLGRVAAFTASSTDDAETWPAWEAFSKFWSQLVRWTMSERTAWDYALDVRREEGRARLEVRTFSAASENWTFTARLHAHSGKSVDVPLAPTGIRRFSAILPSSEPGTTATMLVSDRSGGISERSFELRVPTEDDAIAREIERREPNLPLLRQIADSTGGTINPGSQEFSARTLGEREVVVPLDGVLVPLALITFLADVASRRLRGISRFMR